MVGRPETARARPGEVVERGLAVDIGKARPRASRVKMLRGATAVEKRRAERLADELEAVEQAYADRAKALGAGIRSLEARAAEEKARFDKTRTSLVRDLARAREKL